MIYKKNRFSIHQLLMFVCSIVISACLQTVYAAVAPKIVLDVYGTNQITTESVQKKLGTDINSFVQIATTPDIISTKDGVNKAGEIYFKIITELKRMGKFAFIDISTLMYSNEKTIYITIDAVDLNDTQRLSHFLPKPTQEYPDPDKLIANWLSYETVGNPILSKAHKFPSTKNCPVFHCSYGYEEKELAKYKDIFMELVPKNKDKLILILRNDKDEKKRAAAAFLLAHIKDGHELIKILIPSMFDSSYAVRNNVLRVLWQTLLKVHTEDFPIEKAIIAADFPIETDRNKALLVLFALSSQTKYAIYIKQHAAALLIKCLHQNQPNIHNTVYDILKQISGKNYGSHDYAAWEQWLKL